MTIETPFCRVGAPRRLLHAGLLAFLVAASPAASAPAVWTEAPQQFVVLRADAGRSLEEFSRALEEAGGHAGILIPPRAAIVFADDAVLADRTIASWIESSHRDAVDAAALGALSSEIRALARAWNQSLVMNRLPLGDEPMHAGIPDAGPPPRPLLEDTRLARGLTSSRLPYGAQYYDCSEYMSGSAVVGIWLLEAAGSTYDWSKAEEDQTIAGIQNGLVYWVQRGGTAAGLSFYFDIHRAVPVSGVPIENPMDSDQQWIGEALTWAGWTGDNAFAQCIEYNNAQRDAFNTNWCYSIFVVDSDPKVNQGLFSGGGYAWAYLGGPWVYMSRYSSWAYNATNYYRAVPMHETGHIFMATDEYDGTQEWSGYLNASDTPSSSVICTMNRNVTGTVCQPTRNQLGWRDLDGDGVIEPLDTAPAVTLTPVTPDPSPDPTHTWSGVAQVTTLPNLNPYSWYYPPHAMTLVRISQVECRVDGGPWSPAAPVDGIFDDYQENFSWEAPPLCPGTHTVEARARTTAGIWNTALAADVITIDDSSRPLAPGAPVASTDLCEGIRLSWTWTGAGPDGFKVFRNGLDSLVATLADPAARSWLDASVPAGITQTYQVLAYNACGNGAPSLVCAGSRLVHSWSISASGSQGLCGRIDLQWIYSGQTPDGFTIMRGGPLESGSGGLATVFRGADPAQRSWTDSTASAGTYMYMVLAYDRCDSIASDVTIGSSQPLPPPFFGTCAANLDQAGSIEVRWSWNWHQAAVDGFRIFRDGRRLDAQYRETGSGLGIGYFAWRDTVVIPGVVHDYEVRGYVACGETVPGALATGAARPSPFAWPAQRVLVSDAAAGHSASVVPVPHPETGEVTVAFMRHSATSYDLYAQRFDASGQPLWDPGGVPVCTAIGDQHAPVAAADGEGGVYLAWWDQRAGDDIYAQRISSTGQRLWTADGVPVCTANGFQSLPLILPRPGGVVVTWSDNRLGDWDTFGQWLDASDGTPHWVTDGVTLVGGPLSQSAVSILDDSRGGAFILAHDGRWGGTETTVQHVATIDGTPTPNGAGGYSPTTFIPGAQNPAGMVPADSGQVIVSWVDGGIPSGRLSVLRLRADLTAASNWPDTGMVVGAGLDGFGGDTRMCSDYAGGGFIVWIGPGMGIYVQHIDSAGRIPAGATLAGVPICLAPLARGNVSLVPDGMGGCYAAWGDGRTGGYGDGEVYLTRVGANGQIAPGWPADGLGAAIGPGMQSEPALAHMSTAGVILGWQESGGTHDGLYVKGIADDLPTPTLVELFRAVPTAAGIRVEWQLSDPNVFPLIELHRGMSETGPWSPVQQAPQVQGRVTSVLDDVVAVGQTRWYRLSGVQRDGHSFTLGLTSAVAQEAITTFALSPLSPNPSTGHSLITFAVPTRSWVRLTLTDVQGREVATLADGIREAGRYTTALSASDLRAGMYFVRLQAKGVNLTRRLLVVK
jgi:hypothetical protein